MGNEEIQNGPDPEPTWGYIKGLIGWLDEYTKFKKFLATRRAIRSGTPLVDLSTEELKAQNLMGPLTFNVYESTLAGLPSLVIALIIGALFPLEDTVIQRTGVESEFTKALVLEASRALPPVSKASSPFIAPLLLLCSSFVMGWGALESFDSTSTARRRSRNGFLYYDGAYGLLPQTLLATAIGLGLQISRHGLFNPLLVFATGVLFLTGGGIQIYLVVSKIPELLFALNGYGKYGVPSGRYNLALYLLNPICSWLLLAVLVALEVIAAYAIAFVTVWLRMRLGHSG